MAAFRIECENERMARWAARVLHRLPPLAGAPIQIERAPGLRDRRGPVHAGSYVPRRRIAFDCGAREFDRILVHELFHFVWVRLGNARRWSWEELLRAELGAGARGELGWSAEWRKDALSRREGAERTRRWREYCCESFCDSAAWRYSGSSRHEELSLAAKFRAARRAWFDEEARSGLSI